MKPKFFITTTVAQTLSFFKGQPRQWNEKFDVCAISSEFDELKQFAEEEGIKYKYIPMKRKISLFADIASLFRWIWLLLKERPNIVHGNTPKAALLSMIAAWLTRRPVRIYMLHGLRYQTTQGRLRRVLLVIERLTCNCATHIICVSEGVRRKLEGDGLCKEGEATVIGYGTAGGIDTERFSTEAIKGLPLVREQLRIPSGDFVFCFVGRIVKEKGINELVTAFDRLSQENNNVNLLLVGPSEKNLDPIAKETDELIAKNKRIYAVGKQNDVRPWLIASNAFVLPSYREGVGMVLLEANAMGVPCIASDIIGCNDVVVDGVNGEFVASQNTEALYKKMREWIANPEKVAMMAATSRSHVLNHYEQSYVRNNAFDYCIQFLNAKK